jgi:hypothetical protein
MNLADENIQPPARLQFLTGWQTMQHGSIKQGGLLIIEYDPWRLPNLRREFRDAIFWRIQAFVRFHPGSQLYTGSVLEGIPWEGRGPIRDHRPKPFEVEVPKDSTQAELWFRSGLEELGYSDVAWDSRFAENYWFDVVPA